MAQYAKILVAIDLTEESEQVLEKAVGMAASSNIHLVYVSEPLTYLYGGQFQVDLTGVEDELKQRASETLANLGRSTKIPTSQQHVIIGKPAAQIKILAEEIDADLIVLGSHSRHGLGLLLGSTANGVLHGAPCDVLTVRID